MSSDFPTQPAPRPPTVTVGAPARLHLGFLDPGATLGRRFGSLGLVIDGVETRLSMQAADTDRIGGHGSPDEHARIAAYIDRLRGHFHVEQAIETTVHRLIPAHAGMGSGTQLALATGTAFAHLFAISAESAGTGRLAGILERGKRSGIGISGFDHGGLLVDGGPPPRSGTRTSQPALLARLRFPEAWRVLLVEDPSRMGLNGERERAAIAAMPPFPEHLAAHLCHLVLMRILPAASEADFEPFAHGVSELQQTLGNYFAQAQGGVYTSAGVARVMESVALHQVAGIGQSSWGPTGFAILPSQDAAEAALAAARDAQAIAPGLAVSIVGGRNRGASVETCHADGTTTRAGRGAGLRGTPGGSPLLVAQSAFF